MKENRCVICGAVIPEGRQVCPICEKARMKKQIEAHFERIVNPPENESINAIKAEMVAEFIERYPDITSFDISFETVNVSGNVARVAMTARAEREGN